MSRSAPRPLTFMESRAMRASRPSFHPLALALALAVTPTLVQAQAVSGDQRFTPVLGQATPLYPQSPESQDRAPQPLYAQPGNVTTASTWAWTACWSRSIAMACPPTGSRR